MLVPDNTSVRLGYTNLDFICCQILSLTSTLVFFQVVVTCRHAHRPRRECRGVSHTLTLPYGTKLMSDLVGADSRYLSRILSIIICRMKSTAALALDLRMHSLGYIGLNYCCVFLALTRTSYFFFQMLISYLGCLISSKLEWYSWVLLGMHLNRTCS